MAVSLQFLSQFIVHSQIFLWLRAFLRINYLATINTAFVSIEDQKNLSRNSSSLNIFSNTLIQKPANWTNDSFVRFKPPLSLNWMKDALCFMFDSFLRWFNAYVKVVSSFAQIWGNYTLQICLQCAVPAMHDIISFYFE